MPDIITDSLNRIMNAKRASRSECITKKNKLLMEVYKIMKKHGYIDYRTEKEEVEVKILRLNKCKAIRPRFYATKKEYEKFMRRFLPSRELGMIIVSTSKGVMTHKEAIEKSIGGALIAYCF